MSAPVSRKHAATARQESCTAGSLASPARNAAMSMTGSTARVVAIAAATTQPAQQVGSEDRSAKQWYGRAYVRPSYGAA